MRFEVFMAVGIQNVALNSVTNDNFYICTKLYGVASNRDHILLTNQVI